MPVSIRLGHCCDLYSRGFEGMKLTQFDIRIRFSRRNKKNTFRDTEISSKSNASKPQASATLAGQSDDGPVPAIMPPNLEPQQTPSLTGNFDSWDRPATANVNDCSPVSSASSTQAVANYVGHKGYIHIFKGDGAAEATVTSAADPVVVDVPSPALQESYLETYSNDAISYAQSSTDRITGRFWHSRTPPCCRMPWHSSGII